MKDVLENPILDNILIEIWNEDMRKISNENRNIKSRSIINKMKGK